jgi:hypothetical protein
MDLGHRVPERDKMSHVGSILSAYFGFA